MRAGVHTAPSKSITVVQAAENWIKHVEREGRERATVAQYRQHVDKHINPRLGRDKLAALTTPQIKSFRDDLLADLSRPLARKVLVSLKSILREAQRRGDAAQNVATSVSIGVDKRTKRKLKAGVDIPTPDEVKRMIDAASGKWRALLVTVVFTGLRASELRGLRWEDVDLKRRRAPRSATRRPLQQDRCARNRMPASGPFRSGHLWSTRCGSGNLPVRRVRAGLVFPTSTGRIEHHANMLRALAPVMIRAGLKDRTASRNMPCTPSGISMRHGASIRKEDGGLGLPAKVVQELLGHSSILMTMDTLRSPFPARR